MTEQAVTDKTDDVASQASEATGEQNMDELLSSYDEKAPNEPAAKVDGTKQLLDELVADKRQRELEIIDRDYKSAATEIAGKLDLPYNDDTKQEIAEGLVLRRAEGDRRVMSAFSNRRSDPTTWNAILQDVADKISNGKIDKEATKSRTAMRQSMRGSTETASDDNSIELAKELRKMSDSEFREFKENHRG